VSSRTIVSRARAFRPVLLAVILFWVCVFAAFAAPTCAGGWALVSGAAGWGGSGHTGTDVCAYEAARLEWDEPISCTQTGGTAEMYAVYLGTSYGRTVGCASWDPGEEEDAEPWVELDLLHAIVGALWFFSLMHGFSVGRVST